MVNLMDAYSNSSEPDTKVTLPEDLDSAPNVTAPAANIGGSPKPDFWILYKNWIFLGVAVFLLFATIIFSINKSNQELDEQLATSNEVASSGVSVPSYFRASLGTSGSTASSAESIDADFSASDEDDAELEDLFGDFDEDDNEEEADLEGLEGEDLPEEDTEEDFDALMDELFGSAESNEEIDDDDLSDLLAETTPTTINNNTEADDVTALTSNTYPEILIADEMQGDTGPAVWLALLPSMLYGIMRLKK